MNLLSKLFRFKSLEIGNPSGDLKTSGELVAEVTDGANLVEGKQTWELADNKKDDIDYMKKCCYAELKTMETADLVAAPYYFERVAILSRKKKNYEQEVSFCERYIAGVEAYYQRHGIDGIADVRQGPRFQAIVNGFRKPKNSSPVSAKPPNKTLQPTGLGAGCPGGSRVKTRWQTRSSESTASTSPSSLPSHKPS